jgi:two-component system chemotaxis response regulator CheB
MPTVLIVDDSPTARDVLASILAADPDVQVIGFADNGRDAVEMARKLHPDVITMDLNMPVMDGFQATKEIMIETPTPIVVVSATSRAAEVETAMQAMRAGALTLVLKPEGPASPQFAAMSREIVNTVKAMAEVLVIRRYRRLEPLPEQVPIVAQTKASQQTQAVAIVASTGGPPALEVILGALPADFPAPILVVQHISQGFLSGLVDWLDSVVSLRVKIAERSERLLPGTVYLAPHGFHLGVTRDARARLSDSPPVDGFRPSGSSLLESVADAFGSRALGVILTGMGADGASGLCDLHAAGGVTVAQDEATSVVYGMPRAAVERGVVDHVLPVQRIAQCLCKNVGQ